MLEMLEEDHQVFRLRIVGPIWRISSHFNNFIATRKTAYIMYKPLSPSFGNKAILKLSGQYLFKPRQKLKREFKNL
jgi:hypothetical protein